MTTEQQEFAIRGVKLAVMVLVSVVMMLVRLLSRVTCYGSFLACAGGCLWQ